MDFQFSMQLWKIRSKFHGINWIEFRNYSSGRMTNTTNKFNYFYFIIFASTVSTTPKIRPGNSNRVSILCRCANMDRHILEENKWIEHVRIGTTAGCHAESNAYSRLAAIALHRHWLQSAPVARVWRMMSTDEQLSLPFPYRPHSEWPHFPGREIGKCSRWNDLHRHRTAGGRWVCRSQIWKIVWFLQLLVFIHDSLFERQRFFVTNKSIFCTIYCSVLKTSKFIGFNFRNDDCSFVVEHRS